MRLYFSDSPTLAGLASRITPEQLLSLDESLGVLEGTTAAAAGVFKFRYVTG